MMKITALYTPPQDAEAFEQHYVSVHKPLVDTLPGLIRQELSLVSGQLDGKPAAYHRITDLYFADSAAVTAAFSSEIGMAAGKDAADLCRRTGSTLTLLVGSLQ